MRKKPVKPETKHHDYDVTPYNHETMVSQGDVRQDQPVASGFLAPVVVFLLVVLGVFFSADYFRAPREVEAAATPVQTVYDNFRRNIEKIGEHLKTEPKGDADSVAGYSQDGADLITSVTKDRELLAVHLESLNSSRLDGYEDSLRLYLEKADELIAIEEENVMLGDAVSSYIKEFRKQAEEIALASRYVESDPDRFIATMDSLTSEMERYVHELGTVKLTSDMKDSFEDFVELQNLELLYLKAMKEAIDNRSQDQVASATLKYTSEKQLAENNYNLSSDRLEKKIRNRVDELAGLADAVSAQYDGLRYKYRF